jgi:hypothetical protein
METRSQSTAKGTNQSTAKGKSQSTAKRSELKPASSSYPFDVTHCNTTLWQDSENTWDFSRDRMQEMIKDEKDFAADGGGLVVVRTEKRTLVCVQVTHRICYLIAVKPHANNNSQRVFVVTDLEPHEVCLLASVSSLSNVIGIWCRLFRLQVFGAKRSSIHTSPAVLVSCMITLQFVLCFRTLLFLAKLAFSSFYLDLCLFYLLFISFVYLVSYFRRIPSSTNALTLQ